MILYEYLGETGRAEVSRWRLRLEKAQLAQFDACLDQLEALDDPDDLPGLLAGTDEPHIYKLQIGGKIRLRPMVCRGPQDGGAEITVLFGAFERNGVLDPFDAAERAGKCRAAIVKDATRRRLFVRPPSTRRKKKDGGIAK